MPRRTSPAGVSIDAGAATDKCQRHPYQLPSYQLRKLQQQRYLQSTLRRSCVELNRRTREYQQQREDRSWEDTRSFDYLYRREKHRLSNSCSLTSKTCSGIIEPSFLDTEYFSQYDRPGHLKSAVKVVSPTLGSPAIFCSGSNNGHISYTTTAESSAVVPWKSSCSTAVGSSATDLTCLGSEVVGAVAEGGPWPEVVASLLAQQSALLRKLAIATGTTAGGVSAAAAPQLPPALLPRRKWRNRRNRQRKRLRRLFTAAAAATNTDASQLTLAKNTKQILDAVEAKERSGCEGTATLPQGSANNSTQVHRTLRSFVRLAEKVNSLLVNKHIGNDTNFNLLSGYSSYFSSRYMLFNLIFFQT